MRLTIDISPCPNDTFMFDALVNRRIDTRGFSFDVRFADIEELNRRVMGASADSGLGSGADISKISYAVLPLVCDRYAVLDSGSALGHGNGPLLVCREGGAAAALLSEIVRPHTPSDYAGIRVVVPGFHTTANLLLDRLFPELTNRNSILFSQVARTVAAGNFDAGVLIHEGRFTYRDHGLVLVADLGAEWERATAALAQPPSATPLRSGTPVPTASAGLPLPLGAIVASRVLSPDVRAAVEELIRESILYAFAHPEASREFVKQRARETDDAVIEEHIKLFVNDYSLSLGATGRRAVRELTGVEIAPVP